ncbi:MAG: competence protein ComEC [Solirubrobacteraceae bacterium]|nr:competence protein ComEC [Solirubrobacteraceae bacterium]
MRIGSVVGDAAAAGRRSLRAGVEAVAGAAGRRWRHTIDAARDAIAAYPRHVLLAAIVAGLLAGPRWPIAIGAIALLALGLAPTTGVALGALAALAAGAGLADARLAALDRSALVPHMEHAVQLRATLLDHARTRQFGTRVMPVRLLSQPGRGERVLVRVPSRVTWPARAKPGSELILRGRLTELGPNDAHERRRNAHALLRADSISLTGRRRGGLSGALDGVRARTEPALTVGMPAAQGALARGMVLGQDAALPDELREDFRVTGLAHLVAASGANVLLLATLVLAIGTLLGFGLTARLSLALLLVALYVPLAGAGPSIQRAGVMGGAGLVAALAGRSTSRWYALLLAAAVTLTFNPRVAEDVGWQLSFAAVLAMLALVAPMSVALHRSGLPRGVGDVLAVTAAATLGTAPLIALHFERLSLVSLPVNLLAAPAVAPVMWLGTIAAALGQAAPDLAAPVTRLAALPLGYLTWLADRAAALPFAEFELASPGPIGVAAIYGAAIAAVLAWRRWRARREARADRREGEIRSRGAFAVVACVALAGGLVRASRAPQPPRDLTISFLDIGQGDSTLIQHGAATVLVDTGPPDGPILERLRAAGVRRLDALVLTHDALDHDGATAAVLDAFPVGLVVDGEEAGATPALGPFGARPGAAVAQLAARRRLRRIASDAGQVLRVGPIELHVLWPHREPAAPPGAEPNDRATVLHVRDGAFDLLLTADAESNVTAALNLPVVEALKVAHHGSDDPGLPGLLERLRPKIAVIEVGAHNTYGHPTPATLTALRTVPIVRRTDRDGTVRLRVRDGRMAVESAT